MGYYINPAHQTKEEFLRDHGVPITPQEFKNFDYSKHDDKVPVCLVDNQMFKAAGIAYDTNERDEFSVPDTRPRRYFLVPVKRLGSEAGFETSFPDRLRKLMSRCY